MNLELFNNTKIAAYFIWEYTKVENALNLWYCAEDIASYLETYGLLNVDDISNIVRKDKNDFEYVQFVRHIAFRLFIYTNRPEASNNWFNAEELILNGEWVNAVIAIANIYSSNKDNMWGLGIRCSKVREYYFNC